MGPNINVLILPRFALSWLFTSVMINFDDRMTHWFIGGLIGTEPHCCYSCFAEFLAVTQKSQLEMLKFRDQWLDLTGFTFWFGNKLLDFFFCSRFWYNGRVICATSSPTLI